MSEPGVRAAGPRILVAGIGNVFLGDDGFGVEVVRRLAAESLPGDVLVADFGSRGMHLAYELREGRYETTVLVDASPRGGEPGTVYVIEPDLERRGASPPDGGTAGADAHGMTPQAVFDWLESLGGKPGRVLVVGCEPGSVEEEMGLTPPVARAVDEAVRLIKDLVVLERVPVAG
jgi:hydrogenase maturation protease